MSRTETIGCVTLILGDARKVLEEIAKPAAILADPPYGKRYRSRHNEGRGRSKPEWARKNGNFASIAGDFEDFDPSHLLALNVPTVLWGAHEFYERLPKGGRMLVWDKLAGKTPTKCNSDVEVAWCSEKGPSRIFTHLWRGIIRAGEENVTNGPKLHSHQKPVALIDWCLQFLPSDGVICDPYMGSGTTGLACLRRSRPFLGIEVDPVHFETALQRLQREVAKPVA